MEKVRASLLQFMEDSGKSQRQVAREIGISSTQLSQFMAGKYEGDADGTATKISQYITVAKARLNTDKTVLFYPDLHNTKEVFFACFYAHHNNEIALVCGDAGAGKTAALNHYKANNAGVIMVTANACTQSPTAILQMICEALGKRPPARRAPLMKLLVESLEGTNRLIIVDEADHLSLPALQALRNLNDMAHVGVLLAGNDKIYLQMYSPRRGYEFDQIRTRIVLRKKVTNNYSFDEISNIFPALDTAEQIYLAKLANQESLRTAKKIYQIASEAAQLSRCRLNAALLRKTQKEFLGYDLPK